MNRKRFVHHFFHRAQNHTGKLVVAAVLLVTVLCAGWQPLEQGLTDFTTRPALDPSAAPAVSLSGLLRQGVDRAVQFLLTADPAPLERLANLVIEHMWATFAGLSLATITLLVIALRASETAAKLFHAFEIVKLFLH